MVAVPRSSGRRRRLSPDLRRRELLEAAVRVLQRRGVTACRVEDITTEAGTAKGNFYRYFPTWDDLLIAIRAHLLESYAAEFRRRQAGRGRVDWWQALAEEVDCGLTAQLELGGLHEAVFHGPVREGQAIDDGPSAAGLVGEFLAAGIADAAFAEVDVRPTAALLFHTLHGAADEIAAGADRATVRAATLHIFRAALAPEVPERPCPAASGKPGSPERSCPAGEREAGLTD
jgi:AcrR family transcriptional regulator